MAGAVPSRSAVADELLPSVELLLGQIGGQARDQIAEGLGDDFGFPGVSSEIGQVGGRGSAAASAGYEEEGEDAGAHEDCGR